MKENKKMNPIAKIIYKAIHPIVEDLLSEYRKEITNTLLLSFEKVIHDLREELNKEECQTT